MRNLLLIITTLLLFSCENNSKYPSMPPAVGYYLFEDGTCSNLPERETKRNPIIGVVFEYSTDSEHGKAVSINTVQNKWSAINCDLTLMDRDGRINTQYILNSNPNFADYPIFKEVHALNNASTTYSANTTNAWYIPSVEECTKIYTGLSSINSSLSKLSNAKTITEDASWTSNRNDQPEGYACNFNFQTGQPYIFGGFTANYHTRIVIAF